MGAAFFCPRISYDRSISSTEVPSGYFLTDVLLYADKILGDRLLLPPPGSDKTAFAADEAVKIKKLVQACRGLWRASSCGNHPRMTELKQILKPSPQKEKESKEEAAHLMCQQFAFLGPIIHNLLVDAETCHVFLSPCAQASAGESDKEGAGDEAAPLADDDDGLSDSTMELPGGGPGDTAPVTEVDSSDESVSDSSEVDMRDSQRDSWWGNAYKYWNAEDRLDKTVVPIEVLYQWMLDGYLSKMSQAYAETFCKDDIQLLGCAWKAILCLKISATMFPSKHLYREGRAGPALHLTLIASGMIFLATT